MRKAHDIEAAGVEDVPHLLAFETANIRDCPIMSRHQRRVCGEVQQQAPTGPQHPRSLKQMRTRIPDRRMAEHIARDDRIECSIWKGKRGRIRAGDADARGTSCVLKGIPAEVHSHDSPGLGERCKVRPCPASGIQDAARMLTNRRPIT